MLKATSASPSSLKMAHHQFHISSPNASSLIGSPNSPIHNHNGTPNHPQIQTPSHLQIKKESGHISPVSGSENDQPSMSAEPLFSAKCKRKINFAHVQVPPRGHQPATVARRNARERNRVKQVNNGFAALKQHIPVGHRAKKMSKVETLRCAVDYIRNLQGLLNPSLLGEPRSSDGGQGIDFSRHEHLYDFEGSGSYATSSQQMSPSSSDDPSSPSFTSEASYVNSSSGQAQMTAFFDYENYEPVSPDDEELLDTISIWQQT